MSGELKKLLIEAFRTSDCKNKVEEFTALFNPASYTSKYEVEYVKTQGVGTSGTSHPFGRVKPQDYTFELLFDGTGAASKPRDVHDDIQHFLKVTGKYDGETHRPLYLRLSWGTLILTCVLKSAEISYTLFKPDGHPLRAKVTAVFSEAIEETLRANKENRQSPDMTQVRVVKGGDNLPLMVHRIYGSAAHTVEVARFNGLRHLRDIQPGQSLRFPPLVRAS